MKNTRNYPRILTRSIAALVAACAIESTTHAVDGTWNVDAAGNWSLASNWLSSVIADGAGFTANFRFNITAARTVTLDSARTIGNLVFEDLTTASSDWTLAGTNVLTLDVAAGTSGITVNNRTATISLPLAGNDGVTTAGAGTLILSGANTFTGGLTVSGATVVQLNNNTAASTNAISYAAGSTGRLVVNGGVTIGNTINIGAGITNVAGRGLIEASDANGRATVNGPINITAGPTNGGILRGGLTTGNELVIGGVITSSVQVTQRDGRVIYSGGGTGYNSLGITGTALVGANNGISTLAVPQIALSGAGTLDLTTFNQSLAGITFAATAVGTVTSSTGTLTLNGNVASSGNFTHVFNGLANLGGAARNFTVADGTNEVDLQTGATFSNGTINKLGAGTLTLNGTSGATANVTATAGTISGTGTVGGAVTVNASTTLAPATSITTGTFTAGTLNFGTGATTVRMKIGTGGDLINSTTLNTAGGTTTFNLNQFGGILANGTYPLINYSAGTPVLANFALAPLGHATAALVNTGSAIALNVTANDRVIWDGTVSTNWVAGAPANWKLESTLGATQYIEADEVIFPTAPTSPAVTINATVNPSKVRFENNGTTTYTVSGTAGIAGATGLSVNGGGTVTLRTQNSYSGATAVSNNSTLELDHDATGNLVLTGSSGVDVAAGSTLKLTRDDGPFTYSRNTNGAGTIEVTAHSVAGGAVSHSVTLSGNNTGHTGTLRLLSPSTGTYRIQSPTPAQLGNGTIDVQTGAQLYTAAQTYNNAITIAGTGFAETSPSGSIGALRLEAASTWAGPITVAAGGARIGAHNGTATISGAIGGGNAEFNATNFNNSYTILLTGTNSYGTTTIGGQNVQVAGVPSMRVNVGNGGTTGTLGTGNVTIHGDGANGVLGFDRSDGYTLLAGQTITGAVGAGTIANSITRTFIDFDTRGTGFNDNGNTITLGAAAPASGGNIRLGQARAGTVTNLTGTLTAEKIQLGGVAAATGTTLNIGPGAVISANFFTIGEAASATGGVVNQTDGIVNVLGQLRAGHFGTETSTYNMSGGALTLTGASPTLSPSTAVAGGASATGDNNINALATPAIVGGGIYLGIDGQGIFNHTGGTVTTNWIVLDNRGDSGGGANMSDGVDRYNLSGASSVLNLRSSYGLIARNVSTAVRFGGGTVRVDNSGTGTGTGANITIPLDATIDAVPSTTTNLDTNGAGNGLTLARDVRGTGTLNLTGGGTVNFSTATFQNIGSTLSISGAGVSLVKLGAGATTVTGNAAAFTGNISVSAGRLNLPASLGASAVSILDGAALGGEPTAVTNLTVGSAAGSTVFFDPSTAGALSSTVLLTVNGANILELSALPTGAGPYTAINYVAKAGAGTFAVANPGSYRSAPVVTDTGSAITVDYVGRKDLTWTGAAGTAWNIGGTINWQDTTPAPDFFFNGDSVTLPEGAANTSIALAGLLTPFGINANATTTPYTLTSSVGNQLSGPTGITKTNNGVLTLVGPNVHNGQTNIGGGTVVITAATSLGSGAVGNNIALRGGGRLRYDGSAALDLGINRSIVLGTGGGALSHNNAAAATITVPGSLVGSGTDNLSFHSGLAGAGTFVLTGDNSGFTGAISVDAPASGTGGLTVLRIGSQIAAPAGGSITLNYPVGGATGNATTLDLPGITLPATVTLNMTSLLNGAISLRTQVTGAGNSTINGPITVSGSSIIQFNTSGSLTYNGGFTEAAPFSNVLFFRGTGTHTINANITLPTAGSTVAVTDGATAIINTNGNTFGTVSPVFGTLRLGANDALPATAPLILGQAGDQATTLDLNGFNQTLSTLNFAAPTGNLLTKGISNSHPTATSTFTVTQVADTSFNGTFSGRINLVKEGANSLTLPANASTFTGNVTVNNGTLVASGVAPNGGANGSLGNTTVAGRTITVNSPGVLSFTANNIFGQGNANVATLPAITLNAGTLTSTRYNAIGNITLVGGTLTQSATDAGNYEGYQFRGTVTVPAGGGVASTISTGNGKANHLGANTTFNVANATGNANTDLTVSTILRNQSGDFALAAGALTKSGNGTLALTAANTFTGGVTVTDGTLNVNADAALGATAGPVAISNNAVLQASGTVTTAARTVTLGAGGGTIDTNGQRVNLNAGSTVTGTTLNKVGAGVLTLAGTQTYAALNVDAGDVNLDSVLGTGTSTLDVDGRVNMSVNQTFADLTVGAGGLAIVGGPAFAPEGGEGAGFAGAASGMTKVGAGTDFATNSGVEQTLASISIDAGSVVTLDSMAVPPAAIGAPLQGVPEPGSATLIFGGILTLLGLRRRRQ